MIEVGAMVEEPGSTSTKDKGPRCLLALLRAVLEAGEKVEQPGTTTATGFEI